MLLPSASPLGLTMDGSIMVSILYFIDGIFNYFFFVRNYSSFLKSSFLSLKLS